ncbi:MAG: hypothetical protein P4M14_09830 [Gammaproteobacteria bacterium]|nr:hypothetical protein [Gammaproteobacteria bacterium]
MLNRHIRVALLIVSLCLVFIGIKAEAHPFVIVSAAPPMREAVMPPGGYVSCYTVPPAFYEGVWINAHRVCQYDRGQGAGMWVSGYWQCVRFRHVEGVCLDWGWMPSHWASPRIAEYGVRWRNEYHHYGYDHHQQYREHDGYNSGYHSSGSNWR